MTAPTPPERPTLTLSKTATPAEGSAPASRSTPRNQAGASKGQTGNAWAKPQRQTNTPRANTLRLDGSGPASNTPKQPAKPAGAPARPFSQPKGAESRSTPRNQTGAYGSFNRQDNRPTGDAWGKPQRQDSAPRGGNNRFDAPAPSNHDSRPARAPAGRSTPQNQTRAYGSFNRQDNRPANDAWGKPQRQDSAPRGGNNRFDAPAPSNHDSRPARAPAGRSTPQNQTRAYGSFNRQDNRQADDAWGKPQRQGSAPRGSDRHFDAPAPRNSEYKRPAAQTPRQAPAASAEGVRLNKYLADQQWCSRREADQWIERGWVTINGKPVEMGQRVQEGDRVHVAAVAHEHQAQLSTIILHKPVGYVSGQAEDGHQPALVLITEQNQWQQGGLTQRKNPRSLMGFAPAGRLDIDSTGILILTQDGRMARHIIGEMSEVDKEYLVRVSYAAPDNQTISVDVQSHFPAEQLALLRHGLSLDGVELKPAEVDWQNPEQLRFVLREGKKRQIRRMCEQVGLHVTALKRVRIGQLALGMLPPGQWRYLGEHETI
ncbi:pseudouridine synthase [Lampropedia aestuarii]|uniref:pseudouridine synthase n=1 Tax=Lampropedia aestuarii TaxID=2562762 RepID=UPI002468E985|nr:pseudouridine synthase [Lampropedia aestuarii]MDH5856199.1 pseudouridine synthase [Lampropedia aestuarii]